MKRPRSRWEGNIKTDVAEIYIFSSHLRLGIPSGLFLTGFQTKILYAFPVYSMRATYRTHLIVLDLINLIIFGKACMIRNSSLCSRLQSPSTSSFFSTLFSNTICVLTLMWHIVSHPYKTVGKIIVFYALIFKFLERTREDKRFWTKR
jgi:hypothetical protein